MRKKRKSDTTISERTVSISTTLLEQVRMSLKAIETSLDQCSKSLVVENARLSQILEYRRLGEGDKSGENDGYVQ